MQNEIILSLVTGLVSAVVYSLIQWIFLFLRWNRTKKYFQTQISHAILSIKCHIVEILSIETIFNTGEEVDHLLTDEELIEEVNLTKVTYGQFSKINLSLRQTKERVEQFRKESLAVPTFSSSDFHKVDDVLRELNHFTLFYSWLSEEVDDNDTQKRLKQMLIDVLVVSDKKVFPNERLDKIHNWVKRFRSKIKAIYKNTSSPSDLDKVLPF